MAISKVQYRVTIFADDNATPLTPRAGSAHSDNFQVNTKAGVGGWKPYLKVSENPEPRHVLNRLTGLTEIGEINVLVGDIKVSSNVVRWVTAFLGDDVGGQQLEGKRLRREISLNDGGSWTDDYVGRVAHFEAPDPDGDNGPHFLFVVRDERIQEKREIFVGVPHHSITYARPAAFLPNSVVDELPDASTFDWNGFPVSAPLIYGKIETDGDGRYIRITAANGDSVRNPLARMTQVLARAADATTSSTAIGRRFCPGARIWLRVVAGGASGHFYLAPVRNRKIGMAYDGGGKSKASTNTSPIFLDANPDNSEIVRAVGLTPLHEDHPDHMDLPADGTLVRFLVYNAGPPTPDAPLLIEPTHAAQLLEDICAGKFSLLNDTGEDDAALNDATIAVQAIATDAGSFTTLKGDGTVQQLVFAIDRTWTAGQFIAEQIVRVAHVYGQQRNDGKLYATDLRLTAATASGLDTLDNTDIGAADWAQGEEAINLILITTYNDSRLDEFPEETFANVPANAVLSAPVTNVYPLHRLKRLPLKPLRIDAQGLRKVRHAVEPDWKGPANPVLAPYKALFGDGAAILRTYARRSSKTNGLFPGHCIKINVDKIPNASTNTRGGVRLFQCIERTPDRAGYRFRFLNAGPDSVAVAPTIGSPAAVSKHSISVAVTLNASSEPAELQVASVAVGAARPADNSAAWRSVEIVRASRTVTVTGLASGKRHYVRGISVPGA